MQKGFVVILILAVIIGIFAISNSAVVTIDFIFTEVLLSQAIVIFICVLLGALLATIFGMTRQLSLKKETKHLQHEKKELQLKVDELSSELISSKNDLKLFKLAEEEKEREIVVVENQPEEFNSFDR